MKTIISLAILARLVAANPITLEDRAVGGYIQNPSGSASFTMYSGCGAPGSSAIAA